jgi:hypothetical protein
VSSVSVTVPFCAEYGSKECPSPPIRLNLSIIKDIDNANARLAKIEVRLVIDIFHLLENKYGIARLSNFAASSATLLWIFRGLGTY